MKSLKLTTHNPFDTVPRVLDLARRSGFVLSSLAVERTTTNTYQIELAFAPNTDLDYWSLWQRVRQIHSISSALPSQMPAAGPTITNYKPDDESTL